VKIIPYLRVFWVIESNVPHLIRIDFSKIRCLITLSKSCRVRYYQYSNANCASGVLRVLFAYYSLSPCRRVRVTFLSFWLSYTSKLWKGDFGSAFFFLTIYTEWSLFVSTSRNSVNWWYLNENDLSSVVLLSLYSFVIGMITFCIDI